MYSYPIDYTLYSNDEIVELVSFLDLIEKANKTKVNKELLLNKHKRYLNIINAKSTVKQIDAEFLKLSGYSIYQTIKKYQN
ncbi:MAG: UPF0223 family protein [Candidatus Izemoplasma sp.]